MMWCYTTRRGGAGVLCGARPHRSSTRRDSVVDVPRHARSSEFSMDSDCWARAGASRAGRTKRLLRAPTMADDRMRRSSRCGHRNDEG